MLVHLLYLILLQKLNLEFSGDPNFKIEDIATLDLALPNEISFFHKNKYRESTI